MPPPSPPKHAKSELWARDKDHRWDTGDVWHNYKTPTYLEVLEKNTIHYDESSMIFHWKKNRPTRCATHLTTYRNTTSNGLTVTDIGTETSTSYQDTFGAHSSKGDVHFVRSSDRTPFTVQSHVSNT